MAFRKKNTKLLKLNPDILIIQECEHGNKLHFGKLTLVPDDFVWIGENPNKGLGVFSFNGYTLELHKDYDSSIRYVVPITITGEKPFMLFAIWAMNDNAVLQNRYIAQVYRALLRYKHLINERTIFVGDFNWNLKFKPSPALLGTFEDVVETFNQHGIRSCYHSFFNEEFGKETKPTLYMARKENRPYHVDYCFASDEFMTDLQDVEVGECQKWLEFSDHMPIALDFDNCIMKTNNSFMEI